MNKLDQIGASHQLPILARISERCHLVLLDRHVKIRFFARTVPECNKNVIRRMLVTCANHVQVYEKKSSRKLIAVYNTKYTLKKNFVHPIFQHVLGVRSVHGGVHGGVHRMDALQRCSMSHFRRADIASDHGSFRQRNMTRS